MDEELDVGLWSSPAEFVSFTDEYGETIREAKPPSPLKDMRERGPSEHNSRQLDRHMGRQFWANKGDDVESETVFESDLLFRPVQQFATDHRRRSAVQLDLNRNVTQRETLREDFEPRDANMYSGYNPIVPKKMNHFVPTRRGEQELAVVGAERRAEPRSAMPSKHEDPLRAGLFRKEDDEERGRVSAQTTRAGRNTSLRMGEWSGLQSLDPNDRASAQSAPRRLVRGDASLSQYDSVLSHVSNRVTHPDRPWGQSRERADVSLSSFDSHLGRASHATRSDHVGRAPDAEETVLGTSDSNAARDPQRSTFSDAARVAADLILGVQDSQPQSGTSLIGAPSI